MQIVVCDKCGERPAERVNVYLGREMGPSGSSEDVWGGVDLCLDCSISALNSFLDGKTNVIGHQVTGEEFIRRWTKK